MSENQDPIPFAKPWMDESEAEAARRAILSGWVTQGPEVQAFETDFKKYTGAPHACAVANCTTALHLAMRAVGVRPGDEVITVSHSFIATANSIRYLGAVPVFVDIQPNTFNIEPDLIKAVINMRSRAILCVHQIGMPCDMRALIEIGQNYSLPVIEDAACAVGSEILWNKRWEKIGKPHGDIACFSFHPRKLLTTGDGGMLTTANPAWDQKFRLWRQHSMSVPDTIRHSSDKIIFESYTELGYNYRMTDIQAAVGRAQLEKLPEIITQRREQAKYYRERLAQVPGLDLPHEPAWAHSNWQSFCIRLPEGCDQREVMQALLDENISTRRGVMCAHREAALPHGTWSCGQTKCDCPPHTCQRLQHSEQAQDRTILLPIYHQMTTEQQERVVQSLMAIINR